MMTDTRLALRGLRPGAAAEGQGVVLESGIWVPGNVVRGLTSTDTSVTIDDTDPLHPDLSVAGGGGIDSVVGGTDISIDNTDPDNPVINYTGGGGGGGNGFALDDFTLNSTYGDHFTGSSLDTAKWNRVGYVSGDEQHQMGGGTWLQVDAARAAGNYYYQTAPSGDFTVGMKLSLLGGSGLMFGPLILDSSGNGACTSVYSGPDGHLTLNVSSLAYGGTFTSVAANSYQVGYSGATIWLELNKASGAYKSRLSFNGDVWRPWTTTVSPSMSTVARIGWGSILGTPIGWAVDWFDVR